jgi:HlyD family secretion protein
MPIEQQESINNSEEINEIITAVPSWILRWGITIIFLIVLGVILLSAFIRYPDIVKAPLKINSLNAPKEVIAHQAGKLVKLLVKEGQNVKNGEPLAYLESTAKHDDVIKLRALLLVMKKRLTSATNLAPVVNPFIYELHLGELQNSYQSFYQEFVQFANTQKGGFYLTQKSYLQKDIQEIRKLEQQILKQKQIQEKEYANVEEEYKNYKILRSKNVISNSEFKQQENKYLSGKYPLEQTATALINNHTAFLAKQKELATLQNTIEEQQSKFIQALNSMIDETQRWVLNYVVSATVEGKVGYVGILQENQNVSVNQQLFIINPGNSSFFGEVQVPQYNMGKVALNQKVLVKLHSYPFEEYGVINGKISYLTDVALKDSVFFAKVQLQNQSQQKNKQIIVLKQGMMADAEIITRESSLLQRFLRNITKLFDNGS